MVLQSSLNLNTDSPAAGMSFVFLCFVLRLSLMLNKTKVGGVLGFLS